MSVATKIDPPSPVSRNEYQDFNVGTARLILNNSASNVQSQLGGWIAANPQLGHVPARIVVNEVSGDHASLLRGTIEVAGRRADIVVANPNGITCDGCGFLNTTRATLATGTPVYGGTGGLQGFDVRQGQLVVGAGGLNAAALERLDLIARGMVIEGEVWAAQLNVIAGANQTLYGTLAALPASTPQDGSGAPPRFAIDLKDLGGMYAHQVYLIATEKGLGVNSTGRLEALQGNLHLSSSGQLTVRDAYARQDLRLESSDGLTLTGQVKADGAAAVIASGGTVAQQGTLDAAGTLSVAAAALEHSGTTLQRGTAAPLALNITGNAKGNGGTIYSAGDLALVAANVDDMGSTLLAQKSLSIDAASIVATQTRVNAGGDVRIHASAGDVRSVQTALSAGGALAVRAAGAIDTTQHQWQSAADTTLQAASIVHRGGATLARGQLQVTTPGALNNTGGSLMGQGGVAIDAGSLVNDASGVHQGLIASDNATRIAATSVSNLGGVISGKAGLDIEAHGGHVANSRGVMVSDAGLNLRAGAIDSAAGQIVARGMAGGELRITASSLNNNNGAINTGNALAIATTGALDNTGGAIQAGTLGTAGATLNAASIRNDNGQIASGGDLQVATGGLSNNSGVIASKAAIALATAQASNRAGTMAAERDAVLMTQALDNTGGGIASNSGALSIGTQGQALTNAQGRIAAASSVTINSGALANVQGAISSRDARVDIAAVSMDNAAGTVSANTVASVATGGAFSNAQGIVVANEAASVQTAGTLDNTAGRVVANAGGASAIGARVVNDQGVISGAQRADVASLGTQGASNRGGRIVSDGAVAVAARSLDNTDGTVSARATAIDVDTGALDNTRGGITGTGQLSIVSGAITNASGRIASGNALALDTQGGPLDNTAGHIQSTGALALRTGAINNTQGVLTSQSALDIKSAAIQNVNGELSATKTAAGASGHVAIDTQGLALVNAGGRIVAEGDARIDAGALANSGTTALIAAHRATTLNARSITNTGSIQAGADLSVKADALQNTQGGQLLAAGNVDIGGLSGASAGIDNSAGVISARGITTLAASTLGNDSGRIDSGAGTLGTTGAVSNRGGAITSAAGTQLSTYEIDNTGGEISAGTALSINTNAQALNNGVSSRAGRLIAGAALALAAGGVTNAGTISAVGNANLAVQSLTNTGLVQSQALTINAAGDVVNGREGQWAAAQDLGVNSATLNNEGQIGAGARLSIASGSTTNRGSINAGTDVQATTQVLVNTGGTIAAAGNLNIDTQGAALTNVAAAQQDAVIQAGGTATLTTGALTNQSIMAAQNIALGASGNVANSGVIAAGGLQRASAILDGTLNVATTGALGNDGGTLYAYGAGNVQAASLSNQGGRILAASAGGNTKPGMSMAVAGAIDNRNAGLIAAFDGDLGVTSASLANQAGTLYAQRDLMLATGNVANAGGSVQAGNDLAATTAAFDNTAGAVQSGGALSLNTQGHTLNNSAGRMAAAGQATLQTGAMSNGEAGTIAAGARLTLNATGAISNANGGVFSGTQGLSVHAEGQDVANGGGTFKSAAGDVSVSAAHINNDAGTIAAAGNTTLAATGTLGNRSGFIGGNDITISAQTLVNAAGRINAERDVSIATASTDNAHGEISAKRDLTLTATSLANTGGSLVANGNATITTASTAPGGTMRAGNLTLNVQGGYSNTGTLSAGNNLSVNAASISNAGVITAGNTLSASAQGDITNTVTGELNSGIVQVTAGGTINNQGLINSSANDGAARLTANAVNNNGRLYGDLVAVNANAITNIATGVMAARRHMSLQGRDIANKGPDALLLSLGDIYASADQSFSNTAGRVEAQRSLFIDAASIHNANGGVQTAMGPATTGETAVYIQPLGSTDMFPIGQCHGGGIDGGGYQFYCIVRPELYGQRTNLVAARTWQTVCEGGNTGNDCRFDLMPSYAWDAPQFAQFGVTPVASAAPAEPGGGGSCTWRGEFGDSPPSLRPTPECIQWHGVQMNWDAAYNAALDQLASKLDAYNAQVDYENAVVAGEDYFKLTVAKTTQQTTVTASQPGQLLAGGDMVLTSGSITNQDSRIVAGALLYVNGQGNASGSAPASGVNNSSTQGQLITSYSGTAQFTYVRSHNGSRQREWDSVEPYNPAPAATTTKLPTVVYQQNANALQGGVASASGTGAAAPNAGGGGQVADTAAGGPASRSAPLVQAAINTGLALSPAQQAGTGSGDVTLTRTSATQAQTQAAASVQAALTMPTVIGTSLSGPTQSAREVILTVAPQLTVPRSQLFKLNTAPGAKYLVETDPAFTKYRAFLGSDYFETQLALDPGRTHKRYADGFAEQQLVNDQIMALTGRRYLSDYSSTEAEFRALMDAGVAFAKAYQLTPGVVLSAEQMALLTTDIVWLTTQSVTLPDGTSTRVLVPQVYLRRPQAGDLAPSGALMAGRTLTLQTAEQLTNSGTIAADALYGEARDIDNTGTVVGDTAAILRARDDFTNLSGHIVANNGLVSLSAGRDLKLQTRTLDTTQSTTTSHGSSTSGRTAADRIATVQAGSTLLLTAGRDLQVQGASVDAGGDLQAIAGRNLTVSAVQGSYRIDVQEIGGRVTQGRTGHIGQSSLTQQASEIKAGGSITAEAGQNGSQEMTRDAATLEVADDRAGILRKRASAGTLAISGSNLSAGGDIALQGRNVSIAAAKSAETSDTQAVQRRAYNGAARSDESLVGGNVNAGGNLTVVANGDVGKGQGNITVTGASLTAGARNDAEGALTLHAANDITVQAATTEHSTANESYQQRRKNLLVVNGTLGTTTTSSATATQLTQVEGSALSGDTVTIVAGAKAKGIGNVTIVGSNVVASGDLSVAAGKDLTLTTAAQTTSSESSASKHKSGFMSAGVGAMLGSQRQSQSEQTKSTTQVGATLGSLGGNVSLSAGNAYQQTGSQVLALNPQGTANAGNIDVAAQRVFIDAASDTHQNDAEQKFKRSGLGITLSNPVVDALITGSHLTTTASKTSDPRMQALAAATAGLTAADAAAAVARSPAQAGGIGINLSLGSSRSEGSQHSETSTAKGSKVAAAGDVRIRATGAGVGSTLDITGIDVTAGGAAHLKSDGAMTLQAAQSTAEQHSTNSASSASIGVSFNFGGAQNGVSFNAAASKSRGSADGTDKSHTNTHIKGAQVSIDSGGDTTLKGAVVSGGQITARVGGNLNVESLQDTSTYKAKQESASAGASVCVPPLCYGASSVTVNASKAKVNGDYASVGERSGIEAGEGGFQVDVKGNTDLKGAVIASSQRAIDAGRNSLTTKSLTTSDIENRDQYEASGYSVGASLTGRLGDQSAPPTERDRAAAENARTGIGLAPGIGHESGSRASVTRSGISGGAITITDDAAQQARNGKSAAATVAGVDRSVTTDKGASGALKKAWSGQRLMDDVQAQVQITSTALPRIANEIGTQMNKRAVDLREQAVSELDPAKRQALLAEADRYAEGGTYRVAAHAALGALGGGIGGALGAGASAAVTPSIANVVNELDLPEAARQIVIAAAGTVVGAATGSVAGAATGLNQVVNNYLKDHKTVRGPKVRQKIFSVGEDCKGPNSCDSAVSMLDAQIKLLSDDKIAAMCAGDAGCVSDRQTERTIYTQARDVAISGLSPDAAAVRYLESQAGMSPYAPQQLAAALARMQRGESRADNSVDQYVRETLATNPAMYAAVLGVALVDGDGARVGRGSGEYGGTKGAPPFSHLVPGGGLAAHEAKGGHLLLKHVGETEAALAARLGAEPSIPAASTFLTRAEAEAGVSAVLNARAEQLSSWVSSGARGQLVLNAPFSGGLVLQRGATAATSGTGAALVLRGTGNGGWRIVTGYPTP